MGKLTFGGWAFLLIKDSNRYFSYCDSEYHTTSQRMELTALLKGLEYAKSIRRPSQRVIVYSDSAYAINCYKQEWYMKWLKNGWLNSSGQEVANKDLWFEIIPYFENYWYSFRKVEGHAGNLWNEQCDELAQYAAKELKDNWRGVEEYEKRKHLQSNQR